VSDEPTARIWIGTVRPAGLEPLWVCAPAPASAAGAAAASIRAAASAEPVWVFAHACAAAPGVWVFAHACAAGAGVPPGTAAAHSGLRDFRSLGNACFRDTALRFVADPSADARVRIIADASSAYARVRLGNPFLVRLPDASVVILRPSDASAGDAELRGGAEQRA
jgi:hypothetical protein